MAAPRPPKCTHRGVNAHFQCREYAGNRHVHGTPITLHSSLFTLHSSDFERSRRLVVSRPPLSLRRPLQSPECESNGLNSARNGGQVRPERSFVNCMDAADLRIAAPDRPGPRGSPWPTQIAPHARRLSPQPKATSQGSTAQPGRDGPGAVWGGVSVARGV